LEESKIDSGNTLQLDAYMMLKFNTDYLMSRMWQSMEGRNENK